MNSRHNLRQVKASLHPCKHSQTCTTPKANQSRTNSKAHTLTLKLDLATLELGQQLGVDEIQVEFLALFSASKPCHVLWLQL